MRRAATAIASAWAWAIAVAQPMPELPPVTIAFYRDGQQENVDRNETTVAEFYAEQDMYFPTAFWQIRAQKNRCKTYLNGN